MYVRMRTRKHTPAATPRPRAPAIFENYRPNDEGTTNMQAR